MSRVGRLKHDKHSKSPFTAEILHHIKIKVRILEQIDHVEIETRVLGKEKSVCLALPLTVFALAFKIRELARKILR